MKRHGNLWDKITHPDNILLAYKKARKGKAWQRNVKRFELDVNGNLLKIQKLLCTGKFNTAEYRTKTIYEPKKRDIYVLPFFPDRIVQHALLQIVSPIWDRLMIHDSYACRVGKGMHDASRKTMQHVRKYKYCFKADISKFYPSVDHEVMLGIVRLKIKCKQTLALIENIIRSFAGGKNVPIGNYTSQWLGNLYMDVLDKLLKHVHRIKAYIRYCDDFVIFSDCKKKLFFLKEVIEAFIANTLKLKFSKWSIFPVTHGVDFLGYRHFPNKVLLRKSTATRAKRRMSVLPRLLKRGKISISQYRSSIASTEGWMRWANTFNLRVALQLTKLKEVLA